MSYCPKCGSKIDDESKGCKVCMGNAPLDGSQEEMATILKVIIILMVIFTNFFGSIAGIIGGIILMKHKSEDYRRFGKTLVTVSIVMLAIGIICCIGWMLFNVIGFASMGICY